jgi:hypothetical protein
VLVGIMKRTCEGVEFGTIGTLADLEAQIQNV